MVLNHDCVREVMLFLENQLDLYKNIEFPDTSVKNFSDDDILYSIKKLAEADFINANVSVNTLGEIEAIVHEITWEGHKFLDTIRDDTVWGQTKKLLSKFTSTSLTFVSSIASQVLTNLVAEYLQDKI